MKTTQMLVIAFVTAISVSSQAGFLDKLKQISQIKDEVKKINGDVIYVCQAGAFDKKVQAEDKDKDAANKKAYDACQAAGNSWVFCTPSCEEKVN